MIRIEIGLAILLGLAVGARAEWPAGLNPVLETSCLPCHDSEVAKGDFDLESLDFSLNDAKSFARWVLIHDRVALEEMPPPDKKKVHPKPEARAAFLKELGAALNAADDQQAKARGRAVWRRLNRFEYENTLRDLLDAPWLQIKEILPEDGEAHRFNKVGEALDVSHVQMARYLQAADYALREAMANQIEKPETKVKRYYTRDQGGFSGKLKYNPFNRSPERATFALLDFKADLPVLKGEAKMSVGAKNPEQRERESMGVVASAYEPVEPRFEAFRAKQPGRYKLRLKAFTFWAAPESEKRWWRPSRENVSKGRREEPLTLYAQSPPRQVRRLGAFNVYPDPTVQELEAVLVKGETIRPDPARLFRSRPPAWRNPLATKEGQPGVSYHWLEVEGPLIEQWPPVGHRLMFGDLPLAANADGGVTVISKLPKNDAERLLRRFMKRAYRHPVREADVERFLKVIRHALDTGSSFQDAMIGGYTAVLCSPAFVCLEETPGLLNEYALAARLSCFLWNSEPDPALRQAALKKPGHLRAQAERLLGDPRSERFVDAFLNYWLDLRKINDTSPDAELYPDYYLDDLLVESAVLETRAFFTSLIQDNLPARNLVDAPYVLVNERLAAHYGLPPVKGVELRKVSLPPGSPRGGLMTQASVLKVTANGTTTSPVMRGAWVMERILGKKPPPPPPSVPAIEPDIRGATTIREQLAKHREEASCNACHAKIDPAGFALEHFDVLGGWRERYRGFEEGKPADRPGRGKNGQPFRFHAAQPVEASGELPDGRAFKDVRELKALLLADERQIARNLVRQLAVYATGAPVGFNDRAEVEAILDRAAPSDYGVRSILLALVESELFRSK